LDLMAIYSVHLPADGGTLESAADQVHFERQGFAWAAFFFGPLWLLARGLWRAFVLWCVIAALVIAAVSLGHLSGGAAFLVALVSAFFLGIQGPGVAAAAYDRAGWRFADVVVGENRVAAERNFFSRWRDETPALPRRAMNVSSSVGVIGLFPEAGG
jgi:hypothetical protein